MYSMAESLPHMQSHTMTQLGNYLLWREQPLYPFAIWRITNFSELDRSGAYTWLHAYNVSNAPNLKQLETTSMNDVRQLDIRCTMAIINW